MLDGYASTWIMMYGYVREFVLPGSNAATKCANSTPGLATIAVGALNHIIRNWIPIGGTLIVYPY